MPRLSVDTDLANPPVADCESWLEDPRGRPTAPARCRACSAPPPSVVSRQLAWVAPPGQRYGCDLFVWVGLARQGIQPSAGSQTALCDRFLRALERLHWHRAPALRAARPLGYPLRIDAACERGKGGALVCLDGLTGCVLHAIKFASENESELRPAVNRTLVAFGHSLAIVRDLGSGGEKAVADDRQQGMPDLLCHSHFLAAVGQRLLDDSHAALRNQFTCSSNPLQSSNRDTALWLRIRAWAQDTDQHSDSISDPMCS